MHFYPADHDDRPKKKKREDWGDSPEWDRLNMDAEIKEQAAALQPNAMQIVDALRMIQNDERVDFHFRSYAEAAADEIVRLRKLLLSVKHGAEYPDELGDEIDAMLSIR